MKRTHDFSRRAMMRLLSGAAVTALPFRQGLAQSPMSAHDAPNVRSAGQVINMHNAPPWRPRSYAAGQRVLKDGNAYECIAAGSSVSGPSGTGATVVDGAATWKWLSSVGYTDIASLIRYLQQFSVQNKAPSPWPQPITVQFWNDAEWTWSGYTGDDDRTAIGKNAHQGWSTYGTNRSNRLTITAAPGESFQDHPGVRSSPLIYDPAKGAAIRGLSGSTFGFIGQWHVTISRLQLSAGPRFAVEGDQTTADFIIENCIIRGTVWIISGQFTIRNCLVLGGITSTWGLYCYNNTVAAPNGGGSPLYLQASSGNQPDLAGVAFQYAITNNLIYGFKGPMFLIQGGGGYVPPASPRITHNQTDMANPPSGFTNAGSAADQFVNPKNDFRLKAGAPAEGAAASERENAAADITGLKRPQNGKWDVGCWQSK